MKNKDYILYLDMDGVLVDYAGGFRDLYRKVRTNDKSEKTFHGSIQKEYLKREIEFWANLDWEPGGKLLWKAANKLFATVCILSSTGDRDNPSERGRIVKEGKLQWLDKNIPELSKDYVFIVHGRHLKQLHVSENAILIDDMADTIDLWNSFGGIGILHKSIHYKKTIYELMKISARIM